MRFLMRATCMVGVLAAAGSGGGCSDAATGAPPSGGSSGTGASGSSSGGASSGSASSSGSGSSGGSSGSSSGSGSSGSGSGGDDASSGPVDATPANDSAGGAGDDASSTDDGAAAIEAGGGGYPGYDGGFPMTTDGGPPPSYDGEIPQYPDVPPWVTMDCPGDPTAGYTEYRDTFHVEHPYTLPTNQRFSITDGGIYNFWVFPNDAPHSPTANGRSPRTEASWGALVDKATGGTFTSGQRIWSADCYWESSTDNSVIMQLHTTATGIGPVYMVMKGGSLAPASGSTIGGPYYGKWVNVKVVFTASTLSSVIYVNNCMKGTINHGTRGDGHFYFKQGVYHCSDNAGCRDRYKNIHFYEK